MVLAAGDVDVAAGVSGTVDALAASAVGDGAGGAVALDAGVTEDTGDACVPASTARFCLKWSRVTMWGAMSLYARPSDTYFGLNAEKNNAINATL